MQLIAIVHRAQSCLLILLLLCITCTSRADVITDWNVTARNIVVDSKIYTPPANRVMSIVHTAIYASVNSITKEYTKSEFELEAKDGYSVDAAVASASFTTLLSLLPSQKNQIELAYTNALKTIPEGTEKQAGISIGKKVGASVISARSADGSELSESYRPHTTAGQYVPTVIPAVPHWPNRTPWLLENASQFRPGPPPALSSKAWKNDFNEVKVIGSATSTTRTKEQTAIAKFWEATLPPIYHGVVHSVADQPGRTATQNARLFALVTQASDDALIAVFDAKYHYSFWRPVTAIRNADIDGNEDTQRDARWAAFIPTPMHPEYPCAHCVVAATVGTILKGEVDDSPMPVLTTSSVTANGATRSWASIEEFIQEVSNARIYDGVHYRTSTESGNSMGYEIGAKAILEFSKLRAPR